MKQRLSSGQRQILQRLDEYRPLADRKPGWKTARLFDPRTVRSLIKHGLIQPSTTAPWMIRYNLNDITIKITEQGIKALTSNQHSL